MIPEKDIPTILLAYLNGTLDEHLKQQFEAQLLQDSSLKKRVELERAASEAILKNRLLQVDLLLTQRIAKGAGKSNLPGAMIGVSALLAMLGLLYYLIRPSENKQAIAPTATLTKPALPQEQPTLTSDKQEVKKSADPMRVLPKKELAQSTTNSSLPHEPLPEDQRTPHEIVSQLPIHTVAPNTQMLKLPSTSTPNHEDTCLHTRITAQVDATSTCPEQQSGKIHVSGLHGGTEPYKVVVEDEKGEEQDAAHLPNGTYSIKITDRNNCQTSIKNVHVKTASCQHDFEANPHIGKPALLGAATTSCRLTVYDTNENTYFYKQFEPGETIQWDGISAKGEILEGYYLFVIHFADSTLRHGSITVVR